jgi:Zn/Cd-binding protein ZinT
MAMDQVIVVFLFFLSKACFKKKYHFIQFSDLNLKKEKSKTNIIRISNKLEFIFLHF